MLVPLLPPVSWTSKTLSQRTVALPGAFPFLGVCGVIEIRDRSWVSSVFGRY